MKRLRNSVLLGLALMLMLGIALVVAPAGQRDNTVQASSTNASIFTFVATSATECDVRLADKTVTRAIVPNKATINGIEYTVTSVAAQGFASSANLEKVRLPKTIKTIGMSAFQGCSKLESITLPAVQTINANAFSMNPKLEHIIIPETTTTVGATILRNNSTKVYVRGPQRNWTATWNNSNKITVVDYNSDFVPEITYTYQETATIAPMGLGIAPMGLTPAGYVVDDYQEFITTTGVDIYIPATYMGVPVVGIQDYAFYDNDCLSITIEYSTTPIYIGDGAFWGYQGNVVTINREVVFEGNYIDWDGEWVLTGETYSAFYGAHSTTIVLPDTVTAIGSYSFQDCFNLTDIHFVTPQMGLTQEQEQAIAESLASTGVINLPSSITFIGEMAFDNTTSISEIHIPDSVIDVGMQTFNGWDVPQEIHIGYADEASLPDGWHFMWKSGIANNSIINYATPQIFDIVYDLQGGFHTGNPDTYTPKDSYINFNDATRMGYIFNGWYNTENGLQVVGIATGSTGDLYLEARWTAITYTITYNSNKPSNASGSITGATGTRTYTYDVPSSLEPSGYNLIGWNPNGWNTKSDGSGTSYTDGFNPVLNWADTQGANIILYQQWVAKSYTVTYHENRPATASNAVTGIMANSPHTYDTESPLRTNAFALKGWTFTGWADGSGNSFTPEQLVSALSDGGTFALFAQWAENSYAITYDSNKPSTATGVMSGSTSNSSHKFDIASQLSTNGFSLTGWTFTGWKDADGNSYTPGQLVSTVAASGTATLYAQWTQNLYSVAYEKNKPSNASGTVTGTMANSPHYYDVASDLRVNAYELAGWTFAGWATSPTGSVVYSDQASVSILAESGTKTLYARWTQNSYSVTYDRNRPAKASSTVAGSTPNSSHIYDEPSSMSTNGYTLTGWVFTGWNTKADGSGTHYAVGDQVSTVATSGTGTLFAQWVQNTYTIIYEKNKPSIASNEVAGTMANSIFTYDEAEKLRTNTYTLVGWTFAGWKCEDGNAYTNEQEVTNLRASGSIRLYAQWVQTNYTVTYHGNKPAIASNNVTGSTSASSFLYDGTVTLRANGFALVGWTFQGWATSSTGSLVYTNQATGMKNITGNLYAVWKQNTYTVIYNGNKPSNASNSVGGIGSMPACVYTYDDVVRNLYPNGYTLIGWTFAGWATSSTGSVVYADKAPVLNWSPDNGKIFELFARWTQNTYTVTLDRQGGTGGSTSVTATFDNSMPSATAPTRTGYTFGGYYTGTNGTGTQYYNSSMGSVNNWNIASATTLYAKWTNNTYQVAYNANGGTGTAMANTSHTYDGPTSNLRKNTYTRAGYIFTGWNTAANGTGIARADEANANNLTSSGTITVYAQWSVITYTVICRAYYKESGTSYAPAGHPSFVFGNVLQTFVNSTFEYTTTQTATAPSISGYTYDSMFGYYGIDYGPNGSQYGYWDYGNTGPYKEIFTGVNGQTQPMGGLVAVPGATIYMDAYYTKNSSGGGGICVTEDTLITLADGSTKRVDALNGTESLLIWNFQTGTYGAANIVFIEASERKEFQVVHLFFADGSEVRVLGKHSYWNANLNRYVVMSMETANDYIGHFFMKQTANLQGYEMVELVDVQIYTEVTSAWSPVTVGHLNFYTGGMLCMPGATEGWMNAFEVDAATMAYDQAQMQADIETYGLFTYADFEHLVPVEAFVALNLQVMKVAIGKGMMTWEDVEALAARFHDFLYPTV